MFLYNTLAQNVNDNIFVVAQPGSKVHRLFMSKCHQRQGGNDEDENNSNKKRSAKLGGKIHWSMKHGKKDKNVCNRHRCKEGGNWLAALPWSLSVSCAGFAASSCP